MKAALVVAALAASATAAAAQIAPASKPAFSVERFTPVPGSALWIGVEDADVPAAGRWVVTGSTWIASRPIVLRALSTGAEASEPVRLRWGQEVAIARGLGARYLVGLAVPAALQWGDRLAGIGLSEASLQRAVLGDLRLHGRARIVGAPGETGLAAAVAAALTLPTGDDGDFAGEAGAVLAWGLRAGYRTADVAITGGAGLRLRTEEVVLLSPARPHGNELTASLGVAARLAPLGRQFGAGDRALAPGRGRGGARRRRRHRRARPVAGRGAARRARRRRPLLVGGGGRRRRLHPRRGRLAGLPADRAADVPPGSDPRSRSRWRPRRPATRAGRERGRSRRPRRTGTAAPISTTTATACPTIASTAARASPRIATATATPTAAPIARTRRPSARTSAR
jgi:hypothetical protein